MDLEELTRYFIQESGKTLNLERNPDLEWRDATRGSFELRLPVVSRVSPEFSFLVTYNPKVPTQPSMGVYFEVKTRVFGLDVNGRHMDAGKARQATHLHRPWTHASGTSLVDYVNGPEDLWGAIDFFMDRAKIVSIPEDWRSFPPQVEIKQSPLWNPLGGAK